MFDLKNMQLFQELLLCGSNVYTWCYDAGGALLSSNCPDEAMFSTAFTLFGCKQQMLDYGKEHSAPITIGSAIGINWNACFEKESGALQRAWVIGPVFYRDISMKAIESGLRHYSNTEISVAWTAKFYEALQKVPVVQNTLQMRNALMLHYCLTNEHLQLSDISGKDMMPELPQTQKAHKDRHKVWMAEQALLQMVRTGDLNYKQALSNSMSVSTGVPVQGVDALRQAKTSVIVFISIVCRASIEGGLSPEEAYALGDRYIQTTESVRDNTELNAVGFAMYDDFIRRVHKCRTNPKLSMRIQKCCDYIEMNLEQKIRARDLALLVGYTEYYLTHKFSEETGLSVSDYVKFAKIERAKVLLRNTEDSVQDVSDRLGFSTRNYFSKIFSSIVGCSPVAFRARG